jgi:hypothetical protein
MATYEIETEDGSVYEVETEEPRPAMLGGPNAEIRESPSGLGALINQFMFGAPEGQGIKDYGYYDSET